MRKLQTDQIHIKPGSLRVVKILVVAIFFAGLVIISASGDDSATDPFYENTIAAQHILVANCTLNPAVLMPGDLATVTILLLNTGTTKGVGISSAVLNSKDIRILSDNYGNVGSIGPSNYMPLTFTIQAGQKTGIYYPVFSTEFRGTYFLRYPFKVEVQDIPLDVSVYGKPDTWADDKKEQILLNVGNRRDNMVSGVLIVPSPGSHEIYPKSYVVGNLDSGDSIIIPFNVTPHGENPVNFTVQYKNGVNLHEVNCSLPVTYGKNKKQADLFISNVEITNTGEYFKVRGDVSNSGIETAIGVTVTAKDPADPVFPNKEYGVGILKASEFSNFEVTFQVPPGISEVPLVTSFKDGDGRIISKETPVNLSSVLVAMNSTEMGPPMQESETPFGIPSDLILGAGAVLVILIGIVLFRRRSSQSSFTKVKRLSHVRLSQEITPLPIEPDNGSYTTNSPNLSQNGYKEAMALYQKGEFKSAAEKFHALVEENRMNHRAWNGYGICLTRLGEYQAAKDCYENALLLDPGNISYEKNKEINAKKSQKS